MGYWESNDKTLTDLLEFATLVGDFQTTVKANQGIVFEARDKLANHIYNRTGPGKPYKKRAHSEATAASESLGEEDSVSPETRRPKQTVEETDPQTSRR